MKKEESLQHWGVFYVELILFVFPIRISSVSGVSSVSSASSVSSVSSASSVSSVSSVSV